MLNMKIANRISNYLSALRFEHYSINLILILFFFLSFDVWSSGTSLFVYEFNKSVLL